MSFLYASVLVILLISVLQLTLKMKVLFNPKLNRGKLELKFVGIKVLSYAVKIQNKNLVLTNKKGKNKYLPLELNDESIQNYTDFESILFRKVYFKTVSIYFNFGLKNEAFLSYMVCGYVDVFSKIAYSVFKTKKSEVLMQLKVYPSFESNVIKFGFKAKISISIFDLLWSFFEANITKFFRSKFKQKKAKKKEIKNAG